MTLSISGTTTSVNTKVGAKVPLFKNISIADSLETSQSGNSRGTLTVTFSDLATGQPTDMYGSLGKGYPAFTHTGPGTYTYSAFGSDFTYILASQDLTVGSTPGTAVVSIVATDSHGQTATDTKTEVVNAVLPSNFVVSDQTTGHTYASAGAKYAGTLAFSNQYIVQAENASIALDNLNITAVTPNTFIHSGSGTDAIDVSAVGGNNVLDGSTGSNFLTGSVNGTDTFFVDDRNAPADIWSTIANFHHGDVATLFGVTAQTPIATVDNQGASGYSGLTFHATAAGQPTASFTLAGYAQADIASGMLALNFGTEADGTPYLTITGGR